jgi:hypothetical protein
MTPEITPEYLLQQGLSPSFPQRFWAKVNKTATCWLWTGAVSCGWYGMLNNWPNGTVRAHVASWLLHRGPVPKGLCVLHNCPSGDNPLCVNPAHLWLGTFAENMADKVAKGRQNHFCPWLKEANLRRSAKIALLKVQMVKERGKPIRGDALPQIEATPEYCRAQGFNETLPERFWSKVAKGSDDACWEWIAGATSAGYGAIGVKWLPQLRRARILDAHVVSWILNRGPIPDGLCVLHDCPGGDNRRCVNPRHLWLGSKADNARDAVAKGRLVNPRGAAHPFARLAQSQIDALRASGEHPKALAARYAITLGHVYKILRKRAWA